MESAMKMEEIDIDSVTIDGPFRVRSNTWPVAPRGGDFLGHGDDDLDGSSVGLPGDCGGGLNGGSSANLTADSGLGLNCDNGAAVIPTTAHEAINGLDQSGNVIINGVSSGVKKNTSRRNAWGNMSYADLITQAIQGSPEKRLTLSQIYDWMVQNVPYFKDKGDSNSSAGWKNSIRHNLSLHNRFMRVQNEGTGKSSWWMINPDAKPGKAARRRATSMETQKYEKKRGRVKKKIEALRAANGLASGLLPEGGTNTSPSSSVSEGLDAFPDSPLHNHTSFNLSPDFRPRVSSNASSCGRLSPIPSALESDMHDSQVPPLSPSWPCPEMGRLYPSEVPADQYQTDQQLVELANAIKINPAAYLSLNSAGQGQQSTKSSPNNGQLSPSSQQHQSSQLTAMTIAGYGSSAVNGYTMSTLASSCGGSLPRNGSDPFFQTAGLENTITLTTLNSLNAPSSTRSPSRASSMLSGAGSDGLTPNTAFSLSPAQSMDTLTITQQQQQHQNQQQQQQQQILKGRGAYNAGIESSLLRAMGVSVKAEPGIGLGPGGNGTQQQGMSNCGASNSNNLTSTSLGATASQVMGHLLSLNNQSNLLPNDLDFDSLQGGLECDVDQVIRHELSVDGNLDFNFDSSGLHHSSSGANNATAVSASMATAGNHSWVH